MTLRWLFLLLAVGLLGLRATPAPPNLVVVLIDDMGWGDFSCFGNTEAKTPAVDRLAAEGIRFGQFYVNAPICSPSRCALTTGQYPQRWRITSYLNNRADNQRRGMAQWLDPAAPTLPRLLHNAGYATGHFGKWHLGGQRDVDDAPPITAYGFDTSLTNFEGMGPKLLPLTRKPGDAQSGKIWADAERLGGPVSWTPRPEITGGFVDAALRFINEATRQGKPFYVNVWPDDVHTPLWPPVEDWRSGKRAQYLAVLENMDRQLARLFDHLRSSPALRDNTLVLVCSDNGPEHGAGSAGPFRGGKTTLYEGGIRSPLIVWGPGLQTPAAAGTRDETSVLIAMDLAPSLLRLAGVATPGQVAFDGLDRSDALLGKAKMPRDGALFWRRPPDRKRWEAMNNQPLPDLAVREGDWKLLCDYDGGNPLLYNLQADAGEASDLSVKHPDLTQRLARLAADWHRSIPADEGPRLGESALKGIK